MRAEARSDSRRARVGARRRGLTLPISLSMLLALALSACGDGAPAIDRESGLEEATAADTRRPHVILVIVDTLRADRLGAWGSTRGLTPQLDALAERSFVFGHAIAPANWTKPSVASLLTGRYPSRHGVLGTPQRRPNLAFLDRAETTLAEVLSAAGYRTAAFVSNPHLLPVYRFDQGFDTFVQPAGDADELLEQASRWLVDAAATGPTFSYLHLIDPHAPYAPPPARRERLTRELPLPTRAAFTEAGNPLEVVTWLRQFRKHQERGASEPFRFESDALRPELLDDPLLAEVRARHPQIDRANLLDHVRFDFSGPDDPSLTARIAYLTALYDAEVARVDAAIGRYLDTLRRAGLADETVVVFSSDHGEAFLDGGVWGHGNQLQAAELDVPLLIHQPGGPRGRSDEPVSLVDLAPTLTELLGLPPMPALDGHSLVPLMNPGAAPTTPRGPVFSEMWQPDREQVAVWIGARSLVRDARPGQPTRWLSPEHPPLDDGQPGDTPEPGSVLVDAIAGQRARPRFDEHKALPYDELGELLSAEQIAALKALGYF